MSDCREAELARSLRETPLSKERIYSGRIIDVERWTVRCANGDEAPREVVLHRGAAAVVPLYEDGTVAMVRQHRVAIDKCTWEIPAGKLDSLTEDPFDAAKRELEEETGLQAEQWQKLTSMYTTPGFCNEKIAIYLATGLSQHPSHPDADEFLRIKKIPLDDAIAQCVSGEIQDGKTLVGLLLARQVLSQRDMPMIGAGASVPRYNAVCAPREAK